MKNNIVFSGNFSEFRDRIDSADFVVGINERSENGVSLDSLFEYFWLNHSILVDFQISDIEAFFFELLETFQDGWVFDLAGDDVISFFFIGSAVAEDGEIATFGATRGEDKLVCFAVEDGSNSFFGIFNCLFCFFAKRVKRAWISKFFTEVGKHGFEDFGADGGGGGVVEVDGSVVCSLWTVVGRHGAGIMCLMVSTQFYLCGKFI